MRVKFIGMVNILLDQEVQPEFFQKNVDAAHLADEAWLLLTNQTRRRQIQARLARLPEVLGPTGVMERAAHAVLELVEQPGEQSRPRAVSAGGAPDTDTCKIFEEPTLTRGPEDWRRQRREVPTCLSNWRTTCRK